MNQQPTVAIIRTSSIGDVILASACLDMASKLGIAVVWFGREPTLDLLKQAYPDVTFVNMPKMVRSEAVRSSIKQFPSLKLIVDLQCNGRSKAYVKYGEAQGLKAVAVDKRRIERLSLVAKARLRGRWFPRPEWDPSSHPVQYRAMLDTFASGLQDIGYPSADVETALNAARPNLGRLLGQPVQAAWGNDLEFGQWLALAPGAAHPTKECPETVWRDLLLELKQKFLADGVPISLLVVGGTQDRGRAVSLLDQLAWPWPVLNLAGKLHLPETAFALSKAKLLLTNDSGLLHLAEAVETPVAAVFGPTVEEFGFPPWRADSIVVSSRIGCRPCSRHGKWPCRYGDKLCFESLPLYRIRQSVFAKFVNSPQSNNPKLEGPQC